VPARDNAAMPANHRLVQRIGLVIATAGLVAAAAVHVHARSEAADDPVETQREMRDLERLGGTASVQTIKLDRWLASLWHGERLAATLALLGLAVGGACWWIGGLMGEAVDDDA